MTALIVTIILVITVSALCSFMEAALYSVPWSHVESMRKSGSRAGALLFKLRSSIEQPITAVLTLNTIANTAGAAVAGSFAAAALGESRMSVFAASFTVAILVCSEIIPKTLGVAYCRPAAGFVAYGANTLVLLLKPLIVLSGWLTRILAPKDRSPAATEEDVHAMVSMLGRSGSIHDYEETTIHNILALDKKSAKDIMTPRTVSFCLPSDMTVEQASREQGIWHYSRIPVYGENNEDIIGIVTRRRILGEMAADHHSRTLASLMRPAHFVLESISLDRLLTRFLNDRIHLLVVLDEFGGLAGVVSLEDVLEEMLGREIVDETDEVADLRALARERREKILMEKRPGSGPDAPSGPSSRT